MAPEQGLALASIAAGLSLGLNWEYNHQSVKQALAAQLPEVELALWWPSPDGFCPVTEGAAERFGPWAGSHQLENLWQDTTMRALAEVPGAWITGVTANRQTFGLAVASGPKPEVVQAALKVLLPQLGLARLGILVVLAVAEKAMGRRRPVAGQAVDFSVAVVVPAYNEEKVVLQTVQSLLACQHPAAGGQPGASEAFVPRPGILGVELFGGGDLLRVGREQDRVMHDRRIARHELRPGDGHGAFHIGVDHEASVFVGRTGRGLRTEVDRHGDRDDPLARTGRQ